jgi:hypothetical protein
MLLQNLESLSHNWSHSVRMVLIQADHAREAGDYDRAIALIGTAYNLLDYGLDVPVSDSCGA